MFGNKFFLCSFTVLENGDMDFLLGLDMLKAHTAIIDLRANVLHIGDVVLPFLAEKDIPKSRVNSDDAESDITTTSSSSTTSATPTSTTSSTSSTTVNETSIRTLVDMGVPRDNAIQALQAANGNLQAAIDLLMR